MEILFDSNNSTILDLVAYNLTASQWCTNDGLCEVKNNKILYNTPMLYGENPKNVSCRHYFAYIDNRDLDEVDQDLNYNIMLYTSKLKYENFTIITNQGDHRGKIKLKMRENTTDESIAASITTIIADFIYSDGLPLVNAIQCVETQGADGKIGKVCRIIDADDIARQVSDLDHKARRWDTLEGSNNKSCSRGLF